LKDQQLHQKLLKEDVIQLVHLILSPIDDFLSNVKVKQVMENTQVRFARYPKLANILPFLQTFAKFGSQLLF